MFECTTNPLQRKTFDTTLDAQNTCTIWYMITDSSVEIDAPAAVVWEVFTDAARWPDWTASMTRVTPLDGPAMEIGNRFEIKQPRFPVLVWTVTAVDSGVSWSWEQRSPGGTTIATHALTAMSGERTLVRLRIEARGPIGVLVSAITRRLTRRYLELEAQGLQAASEQRARHDAPSA
jgi:uncharacterized membrane protein